MGQIKVAGKLLCTCHRFAFHCIGSCVPEPGIFSLRHCDFVWAGATCTDPFFSCNVLTHDPSTSLLSYASYLRKSISSYSYSLQYMMDNSMYSPHICVRREVILLTDYMTEYLDIQNHNLF